MVRAIEKIGSKAGDPNNSQRRTALRPRQHDTVREVDDHDINTQQPRIRYSCRGSCETTCVTTQSEVPRYPLPKEKAKVSKEKDLANLKARDTAKDLERKDTNPDQENCPWKIDERSWKN